MSPPHEQPQIIPEADLADRINQNLQGRWQRALASEDYETAARALEEVTALRTWRGRTASSSFSRFYHLFETATLLSQVDASTHDRALAAEELIANARTFSPRIRDLYLGLLEEIANPGHDEARRIFTPQLPMTEAQLSYLKESGDLARLLNPFTSWAQKLNIMDTRVESELKGRKALDRIEKEKQKVIEEKMPTPQDESPPPAQDKTKPGMDEMERLKEGEQAPAIWSISPAYGGYYKKQSFDTWDASTNTWRQSKYKFAEPSVPRDFIENPTNPIVQTAIIPAGKTVRLPSPYTYEYLRVLEGSCQVLIDQNDDYVVRSTSRQDMLVKIQQNAIEKEHQIIVSPDEPQPIFFPSTLSKETEEKLKEMQNSRKNNIDRARALASYTMRRLKYSNDSSFNAVYDSDPDGYIGAIDKHRMADCDVANTYFAALCGRLGIIARHVVGYFVKCKDSEGNARITRGTGHAWTEVWDEQKQTWVRIDATPPGDPQLEQDEQGEGMPGDYGGQEAIGPTDEELQQLEEKLVAHADKLSYTQQERELAQVTGVELKEARQIIKEIQEAENIRLPSGERIVDVLAQVWSLLTQSRIRTQQEYTGPLRKREGGEEIEDIVEHKIGIKSGETDPASRQRERLQAITEQILNAMKVHMIGDKSGSMSQTVDGETKWRLQRRAMYLILSSLDRAQKNAARVKTRMHDPYDLYSQVISFRDSRKIDVDKPLSNQFSLEDKVTLWKSLGNQGLGNGDVAALNHLYLQIQTEHEAIIGQGKEDKTLRVVIACSDGMPDDPAQVKLLAQKLGELNTVVVGVGLTETAAQVPIIFNTPYSRGDLARDLNDLPSIVAKHIVMEAIKLFPERARVQYQKQIDAILRKFTRIDIK